MWPRLVSETYAEPTQPQQPAPDVVFLTVLLVEMKVLDNINTTTVALWQILAFHRFLSELSIYIYI